MNDEIACRRAARHRHDDLARAQLVGVAVVPLNFTVLEPCDEPKLVPEIITDIPTAAEVGETLEMVGVGKTVKLFPLLANPATVTTTFPVVAPLGTGVWICVFVQLVGVAPTLLNVTVLLPCVD